jgi:hypothetical protein
MTTLEQLKEIKLKNALQIYVPSKQKNLAFSHLTFGHYNELLALNTQSEDTVTATFRFNNLLNKIIQECCLDTNNDFTIVDRDVIALQLRVAIDDHFQILHDGKTIDTILKEHCISLSKLGDFKGFTSNKVSHDSIELTLDIPTLAIDQQINTEILTFDKESEQFPSFLLFSEIIKYISAVKVGDAEPVKLYSTDKIAESVFLCQQLPLPLLKSVSEYISNVQKEESKLMSFEVTIPDLLNVSEEKINVPIVINQEWFTNI